MASSLCYLALRRVLQLAALRFRSTEFKELEIVVLRHELAPSLRTRLGDRKHKRSVASSSTSVSSSTISSSELPGARVGFGNLVPNVQSIS